MLPLRHMELNVDQILGLIGVRVTEVLYSLFYTGYFL